MESKIYESMNRIPDVEGPVAVSSESYPFCAMDHSRKPLDIKKYGYVEEEYFISGAANVYDEDGRGNIFIKYANLPYKNRVLVRRPKNNQLFSGRIYMDILNATQGYDIEDLWHRSYLWCMENGHGYIGVTSKPVSAESLKNFDYDRYKSLNWSGPQKDSNWAAVSKNSIPGTEEGLFWDMIGQIASLLRRGKERNCFKGLPVDYLCLTGQSQSGIYLNTFIDSFHKYCGKPVSMFDGYLNIAGVPLQRELCQGKSKQINSFKKRNKCCVDVPCVFISSESDLSLFPSICHAEMLAPAPDNCDNRLNKCRYYEVAGSPHTDINCPILPADSDIKKARPEAVSLKPDNPETLNDFPLSCYINGLLEKLYIWAAEGIAPEITEPIKKDLKGSIVRDDHGNAKGGLRSPFIDIPLAAYYGYSEQRGGIGGDMCWFTKDKFYDLYGTTEVYLNMFEDYTIRQADGGWISSADANRMILWSKAAAMKY